MDIDDVVAVVETDKVGVCFVGETQVSMDVRCDKAGYLVKQLANPDDTVKVGAVIAEMDTEKC